MKKQKYNTPLAEAIRNAYARGEGDEDLEPIILVDEDEHPIGRIKTNDALIFANIRGEREVELTQALTSEQFEHFPTVSLNLCVATMIEYHPDLTVNVAFPPTANLENNITEYLSKQDKCVLKCVESEKAIHLTYFFNGKQHKQFKNEERIIIPSHETEKLAEFPEMKALKVSNSTIKAMEEGKHELIVTNLSPCDVMGHIEKKAIVGKAIHTVDEQLDRIVFWVPRNFHQASLDPVAGIDGRQHLEIRYRIGDGKIALVILGESFFADFEFAEIRIGANLLE